MFFAQVKHAVTAYTTKVLSLIGSVLMLWAIALPTSAGEALCAEVKIEIQQELTLERQGFEAIMRIHNSLDTFALEDVSVKVHFVDKDGVAAEATINTDYSDADFYIRLDSQYKVTGLSSATDPVVSNGSIAAKTTGELRWLIIPSAKAAGDLDSGKLFYVGATLSYSYGGKEEIVNVAADSIVVKPQPKLSLDYFLTQHIIADDAFTTEIEAAEPYTLGVRVNNRGAGTAKNLKIESAQPRIVENKQDLAINFNILESYIANEPAAKTLLLDFGEISGSNVKAGRWVMETSLSGKFTEFTASFTHAEDLGGSLTSLLTPDISTYFLLRDVQMDLAGRDQVRDFLAHYGTELYVFESEHTGLNNALDPACENCALVEQLPGTLEGNATTKTLAASPTQSLSYIRVDDPFSGAKVLARTQRSDGKTLLAQNAWLSKERDLNDETKWLYFINVFDSHSTGSYTLHFGNLVDQPQAPVIQVISDRTTFEGSELGFLIQSSDPNGTVPTLSVQGLPSGASFIDQKDGNGVFNWPPAVGQAGAYDLKFIASDGTLTKALEVNVLVHPADDIDGDKLKDAWEIEHFGDLNQGAGGDYDADGRTNLQEQEVNSDPKVAEAAPAAPSILMPLDDSEILDGAEAPLMPTLSVTHGTHPTAMVVEYLFEVYQDAAMLERLGSKVVIEGATTTSVTFVPADLNAGQSFEDNRTYYWRARAQTRESDPELPSVPSDWVSASFFINTANDAPSAPTINSPAQDSSVVTTRPILVVDDGQDIDGNPLTYHFAIFTAENLTSPIMKVGGIFHVGRGYTQWQVPNPLENNREYWWKATLSDTHGAAVESEWGRFTVNSDNATPQAPSVAAPLDTAEIGDSSVDLRVNNGSDLEQQALTYWFEIDTLNTFDSPNKQSSEGIREGGEGQTQWRATGLDDNTRYFWRARVNDGQSDSAWAGAEVFINSKNDAPAQLSLNNPASGTVISTLLPLLEANAGTDLDGDTLSYEFEIFRDSALADRVELLSATEPRVQLGAPLLNDSHYYWRARALDEHLLAGPWSPVNHLMTNDSGVDALPSLSFVLPDADIIAYAPLVLLQWVDSDSDSSALINLYYTDQEDAQWPIASNIEEDIDGEGDQYQWDVSALAPGRYTVQAVISDGLQDIASSACCDVVVPDNKKSISIEALTPLHTDEAGVSQVQLQVSLQQPLEAGTSLTLNLALSDHTEGHIVGASYLNFTESNWQQAQIVTVRGLDDCDIDGDRDYNLVFHPAVSGDNAYNGFNLDAVSLTNTDNENQGQTLFICDYEQQGAQPFGNNSIDTTFKAKLFNTGQSLQDASAQLSLIADSEGHYQAEIVSSNTVAFAQTGYISTTLSTDVFTLRHPAGSVLDLAKLQWLITPGLPTDSTDGDVANNIIQGTTGDDIIDGKGGNDRLYGGDGNDTLIGGAGADDLYGELGDDLFLIEGNDPYADKFDGGEGFDTVRGGAGDDNIRLSIHHYNAVVERIDGGAGHNAIYGDNNSNDLNFSATELINIAFIDGLGGGDNIWGSQAADVIIGGAGNDYLYGEGGDDTFLLQGNGLGVDRVYGGDGIDTIEGTLTDDIFRYTAFDNSIEIIDGLTGQDIIQGTDNHDALNFSGTELRNILRIEGLAGNDTIVGSQGADIIVGGTGDDDIYAKGGDDTIVLTADDLDYNRYSGGDGTDTLQGTVQNDVIRLKTHANDHKVEIIDGSGGVNIIIGDDNANGFDFSETQLIAIASIDGGLGNDNIQGSQGPDVIIGGLGDDRLVGNGGNDTFVLLPGDNGLDSYYAGEGDDVLLSTATDDVIRLHRWRDTTSIEVIDGGEGHNTIVGTDDGNGLFFTDTELINIASIDAGQGNDTLYGSQGNDVLIGGLGRDSVWGQGGDDTIMLTPNDTDYDYYNGGDGVDTLLGTAGDDVFRLIRFYGAYTVEKIDGGTGHNVIVGPEEGTSIDLSATELINIAEIRSGAGNDTIHGSPGNDVIAAGAGTNYVKGNAGDDVILVGKADTGVNRFDGGEGQDTLRVIDKGAQIQMSYYGNDWSVEAIEGAMGTVLSTPEASTSLDFSATILTNIKLIQGGAGDDTFKGSEGDDTFMAGLGYNSIIGNGGDDTFLLAPGDTVRNYFSGGDGHDVVLGTESDDTLLFNSFRTTYSIELIDGKGGNNTIVADEHSNTIDFSATELLNIASIDGGLGNDSLTGSAANDIIIGGLGSDTLNGGGGDDVFPITPADTGADKINGGEGFDRIEGTIANDIIRLSNHSDDNSVELIDGMGGSDRIHGSDGNNTLNFTDTELRNIVAIEGFGGYDTIYGTHFADTIIGGAGNDTLYGNGGDDTFKLIAGDNGYDTVNGGQGVDTLEGTEVDDTIRFNHFYGEGRVEVVDGLGGTNNIEGSSGNNYLYFNETQLLNIAMIDGLGGNDTLRGSQGNDHLRGGMGNDKINGYAGDDRYYFERGHGQDVIRDMGASTDTDTLSLGAGIAMEDVWLVRSGDYLVLYLLGSDDKVTLQYWFTSSDHALEFIELASNLSLSYDAANTLAATMTGMGTPNAGVITLTAQQQQAVLAARTQAWQ